MIWALHTRVYKEATRIGEYLIVSWNKGHIKKKKQNQKTQMYFHMVTTGNWKQVLFTVLQKKLIG
jgi:hypothetical protein